MSERFEEHSDTDVKNVEKQIFKCFILRKEKSSFTFQWNERERMESVRKINLQRRNC